MSQETEKELHRILGRHLQDEGYIGPDDDIYTARIRQETGHDRIAFEYIAAGGPDIITAEALRWAAKIITAEGVDGVRTLQDRADELDPSTSPAPPRIRASGQQSRKRSTRA